MNALLIAILLMVIGLILLGWFLVRIVRRLTFKPIEGKTKIPPPSVSYISIVVAVMMLVFSWLLFWLGHQLKSFHPFTPPSSIARIEIINEDDPVKSMKVNLYTIDDEGASKVTSLYLSGNSWKVCGQYVKIPRQLAFIFNAENFFKVTDFYGGYIGFKPAGANIPLLGHQEIAGGRVNLSEYVNQLSFLKKLFHTCEFETQLIEANQRDIYEIVLTDSCEVRLDSLQ